MSCRCITPFSLLNAYTGPTGRSGVPTVSWFKNAKGYLWWCAAPVLPLTQLMQGNEARSKPAFGLWHANTRTGPPHPTCFCTDKFRFTSMAVAISVSLLRALPRPGSPMLTASVLGFSCCPAWRGPFALGGTLPCMLC